MKFLLLLILIAPATSQSLTDRVEINDVISEWMIRLDFRINSNYSDNNALEDYYLRKWDIFAVWRFNTKDFDDLVWINDIIQATNPQGSIYKVFRFQRSSFSPALIEFEGNIAVVTYNLLTHYNFGTSPGGGSLIAYISSDLVNCILIKEEEVWKMKEVVFHCSFKYLLTYGGFPTCET